MRRKFICHDVTSTDDGRVTIHMSSRDESAQSGPITDNQSHVSEILIKAPDHMFEDDEMPRKWYEYMITVEKAG